MNFLSNLFSEGGSVSMMRVMSIVALLAAIGLAFTGHDSATVAFLTAAFGGKVSQKYIETSGAKSETESQIKT